MAFYLFVLPAGIAALFAIIQCSPSPTDSIEQAIECLLALLAICLGGTLPVSLLVMRKSVRHAVTSGRGFWIALGITASIFLLRDLLDCRSSFPFSPLAIQLLESWAGFSFNRIGLVLGIVLALTHRSWISPALGTDRSVRISWNHGIQVVPVSLRWTGPRGL